MFLVELWNDNDRTSDPDFRISQQFWEFTHPWDAEVISINGMDYSIDEPHGGMIRSKFGILEVLPSTLANDYVGVDISYSNSDEESRQLLFSGVGFVNTRTRNSFSYDLFSDSPNVTIDTALAYNSPSTLITVFEDYLSGTGWTLDSSLASATNIDVDFTAAAGQLFVDMLSNMCTTYGHYFVVDAATQTIHLREITTGVGSVVALDGFDFYPSNYRYNIPPSKVSVSDEVVYGSPYYFGSALSLEPFSTDPTLNTALATKIRDFYTNSPYEFNLIMPMEYFVKKGINFVTRNKIRWVEEYTLFPGGSNTFAMTVSGMAFLVSDTKNQVVLSGAITEVTTT